MEVRLADGIRPPSPYDLSDLLLAVEVTSPSSRRLDYHIKRDLYLRPGVATYWVIDAEARNVSCWIAASDPGTIFSVAWWPVGAPSPFVLRLDAFFNDALA